MAWTYQPGTVGANPPSSTEFQAWEYLNEISEGIRDRHFALGRRHWPPTAELRQVVSDMTVDSVTDNGDGTFTLAMDGTFSPIPGMPPPPDDGTWWNGSQRPANCMASNFWVGLMCPGDNRNLNLVYGVVIDYDPDGLDPYIPAKCPVRGTILANTNNTLTITDELVDHVTANVLASPGDLVGHRAYIIKANGLWWSGKDSNLSRWIEWPNCKEHWVGQLGVNGAKGEMVDESTGFIEELIDVVTGKEIQWKPDFFTDKEVLVYANDGYLRRLTISGNSKNRLFFGAIPDPEDPDPVPTFTLTGRYLIVAAGGAAFPDRKNGWHKWWYGGHKDSVYVHMDDDVIQTQSRDFASGSVTYDYHSVDPALCGIPGQGITTSNTLDADVYADPENVCTLIDHYFAPHLWKTIRGWQLAIFELFSVAALSGTPWVKPMSYAGATSIPDYTIAQVFHDCNINSGTSTMAGPTGMPETYYFTVAAQYINEEIWYTVRDDDGDNYYVSVGTADSMGRVMVGTDMDLLGKAVVYTATWTRYYPLEFMRMYDETFFLAHMHSGAAVATPTPVDFCCSSGGPPILPGDPACCKDCNGVGQWSKLFKSDKTRMFTDYGYSTTDRTFRHGDLVRFVGQGWSDGVFGDQQVYTFGMNTALREYWDKTDNRRHRQVVQNAIIADTKGLIGAVSEDGDTHATKFSITDKTKHWWVEWFAGGTLHTHTGLVDSGTTTTMTTAEELGNTDYPASCYWDQPERFPLFAFAFEGFTLEVDKIEQRVAVGGEDRYAGNGSPTPVGTYNAGDLMEDVNGDPIMLTVVYKRPITNVTDNGLKKVIHFPDYGDGFEPQAGDTWRIKEPKWKLNRYKDRRVKITYPDQTVVERDILYSDDNTIFWTDELTTVPPYGSTFKIIEFYPGGIWMYSTVAPVAGDTYQKIATGKWWILQNKGTDPRAGGVPFRTRSPNNEPFHSDKHFGRGRKGDFVLDKTFKEMYDILNKLWQTKHPINWHNYDETLISEDNYMQYFGDGSQAIPCSDPMATNVTCPESYIWRLQEHADNQFQLLPGPSEVTVSPVDNQPPRKYTSQHFGMDVVITRRDLTYAYAHAQNVSTLVASTADLYTWTAINDMDPERDPFEDDCPPNDTTTPNMPPYNSSDKIQALDWHNHGDPVQFRLFQKWDSGDFGNVLQTSRRVSDKIGDYPPSIGVWPDICIPYDNLGPAFDRCVEGCWPEHTGSGVATHEVGWAIIRSYAILKWQLKYLV